MLSLLNQCIYMDYLGTIWIKCRILYISK